VFRRLVILVALESMAITGVQVQAQEQEQQQPQSLAEVARQTRKAKEERQKNSGAPKVVVTDDTLGSSKTGGALNFVNPTNGTVPTSEALTKAAGMLDRADRLLNLLAPMDKTTLARFALEGRDVDFPERSDWENKLYAAKQYYVSHGRDLVRETREFVANIQELKASGAREGDPRLQDLGHRALQLMQDGSRTDADFETVVLQGQDMAKQASNH
jgi:hypothetical protein